MSTLFKTSLVVIFLRITNKEQMKEVLSWLLEVGLSASTAQALSKHCTKSGIKDVQDVATKKIAFSEITQEFELDESEAFALMDALSTLAVISPEATQGASQHEEVSRSH